jgi:hypothetical protein
MSSPQPDTALVEYLRAAQALELIGLRVLEQADRLDVDPVTADIYHAHCLQTHGHLRLIEERLSAHEVAIADGPGPVRLTGLDVGFDPDALRAPAELALIAYYAGESGDRHLPPADRRCAPAARPGDRGGGAAHPGAGGGRGRAGGEPDRPRGGS